MNTKILLFSWLCLFAWYSLPCSVWLMPETVQAAIEFQMVSATADTGFGLQSADNLDPSVSTAIQSWCVTYRSIEAQETVLYPSTHWLLVWQHSLNRNSSGQLSLDELHESSKIMLFYALCCEDMFLCIPVPIHPFLKWHVKGACKTERWVLGRG